MWSATGSRRPMRARTCSSGGVGSWTIGSATWPADPPFSSARLPSHHQHLSRAARRQGGQGGGSDAGAATRSAGEPAYPMSYIGAGEGLRPFEPPTGESVPLAPPSPPPLPSPSPMTETLMAREATGKPSTTTARTPPSERKAWGVEVTRHLCAPPGLFGWPVGPTPPPCPPEAEIVDQSCSGRNRHGVRRRSRYFPFSLPLWHGSVTGKALHAGGELTETH